VENAIENAGIIAACTNRHEAVGRTSVAELKWMASLGRRRFFGSFGHYYSEVMTRLVSGLREKLIEDKFFCNWFPPWRSPPLKTVAEVLLDRASLFVAFVATKGMHDPMDRDPDQLLSLDAVARELGVSYETARQLTLKGTLAYVAVGIGTCRRLRRVRREDLDAFKRATRRDCPDELAAVARRSVARPSGQASYF
jgi:excisionase family DNA binding protein